MESRSVATTGLSEGAVMNRIFRLRAFDRDDAGQDLLEYALLAGLIALVAVVVVTAAGTSINGVFGAIAGALAAIPL